MSWEEEVQELRRRQRLAKRQGGKEGIAKQHARGRLTIRERIDALLDPGTFQEQGLATAIPDYDDNDQLTGFVPANYVVGFGRIDGRRIVVGGEDFTLKGGSPNAAGLRKSVYAEHLAVQYKVPLVRSLEGGGGSVKGGGGRRGGTVGEPVYAVPRFRIIADAMGAVPVVSMAGGAVAGFPAGRLVASHFSVMTRHTAQIMIGGPALVERALGVKLTKDELGGAAIHAKSGIVDKRRRRRACDVRPSATFPRLSARQRPPARPAHRLGGRPGTHGRGTAHCRAARFQRAVRHARDRRHDCGPRLVLRARPGLRPQPDRWPSPPGRPAGGGCSPTTTRSTPAP